MAESPTMEVRARLSADSAQFTQGMDKAVKSANEFQQASSKLQSSLTAIGVASGAAMAGLIAFGMKSFKAAAEVERLDLALQAVGASSGKGYETLKSASDSMRAVGIQAAVAQKTTLKFAQSNIDLSKSADLARVAQDLSVASSMSAEEALQAVTFAITTGNTRILRQVGITTGATEAYDRYAATLGKTGSQLNMTERRQAVLNLVTKEGAKAAGAYALALQSPAKLVTLFGDLHNELQVSMGMALVKGFGPIIKSAFRFEQTLVKAIGSGGKLEVIVEALQKVFVKLTEPIATAIDKFSDFIDGLDLTGKNVNDIAGVIEKILPVIAGFGTAFATMAGQQIFGSIPIFGNLLKMLNPVAAGFVAMAMTSTQVQSAMGRLLNSLKPLLEPVRSLGEMFSKVLAVAVSIFAKAIDITATAVSKIIGFFQKYKAVAYILAGALAAVTAGIIAYKVQTAIATFITNLKTAATTKLNSAMLILRSTVFLYVAALVALVAAFVYAWKNSETFREVFTNVFNTVAQVVGTALSFVLTALGNLLITFGTMISPATSFGQTLIKVVQFIYQAYVTAIQGVIKVLIMFLSAIRYVMSGQTAFGKVVRAVLNFVFKAFAVVIGGILKFIGFFLEALGMLLDTHGIVGKIIGMILDFLWKAFATVIGSIIKYIGMFIEFLGNLLDTHSMVGKLIANILDFLIDVFATVLGGIFKYIGTFISFLGDLLDTNSSVGKFIAKVWEFIGDAVLYVVEKIAGFLAKGVGALIEFVKGNKEGLQTAIDLFNKFAEGVGKAIAFIPQILGQAIQQFGSWLKKMSDKVGEFLQDIADKLKSNIFTKALAGPVEELANGIKTIGAKAKTWAETAATPFISFAAKVEDATKTIISKTALDEFLAKAETIKSTLTGVAKSAGSMRKQEFAKDLVQSISDAITKVGTVSTKIGNTILEVTKVPIAEGLVQGISDALKNIGGFVKKAGETVLEAGDIKMGTELVQMLSDASKTIGGAVSKVGDFVAEMAKFEVGDILGDFVEDVVDFAIPQLEKLYNVLEGIKDVEVGKFLVENLSEMSIMAGEKVLAFASAVKSFTTGNVLGKMTDAFGSLADELKKGLGFGDVLAEEAKKAEALANANAADDDAANAIQDRADLMKKIRDAMTAGIESMRDVLTDLQDAAKQFADSLKDTILSFAGLKGVELPDGFIPKAKSLIENMRMRLDKSQQFANQILTLQGLGLDAKAIQDLVEQGPIKGAQLAASILGGGAEAIAQINELQKQISFTGAAIGMYGSEAAFGAKIANAQMNLAEVTDAAMGVRGLTGNNIVIEQGAFVVNVDTTGLNTVDEKADLITQRIQETFAILAKELANR
jgi:phage-related protein